MIGRFIRRVFSISKSSKGRRRGPKSMIASLSLCENLCEKNFPKYAKMGKNWKRCANQKSNDFGKLL